MDFSLKNIVKQIEGELYGLSNNDFIATHLLFDSRRLNNAEGTVFFAIRTKANNGEKYIDELYKKGVKAFVCENLPEINLYPDASFILVKNTITTLQNIAAIKRASFSKPVIAITGSNGKTIVKDWIVQLIDKDKKACYSPRSYNSQIGVSLSVWNLDSKDDLGVFEAGISERGEMQKLENIISPNIGIFTTIGDAHQINFNSLEEKIDEKLILFQNSDTIIYSSDSKDIHSGVIRKYKESNKSLIDWGFNPDAKFRITQISNKARESEIHYVYNNKENFFKIPFIDAASISNSINAFIACLAIGIDEKKLKQRIQNLQSLEMRLEMKEGINGSLIINDSYSSDLMSLEVALNFLNQQDIGLRKTVILSDITQSYIKEKEIYSSINKLLISNSIDKLYAIGSGFQKNINNISIEHEVFKTTEDFLKKCSLKDFKEQIILIKGARSFEFEKISRFFEKKAHETVLEINLTAIANNANYFKSKLNEGTKLMAMVKAHSYGCGGFEIASTLANQNIDYLAVAFADEGIELRENGIKLPIMVMSPEKESISKIIHNNLEPEIYSIGILNKLILAKKEYASVSQDKQLNIHIKLDTGMHRLGMEEDDIEILLTILKNNPDIKIKSIFSHLFGSDNPELDKYTLEQIEKFELMSSKIIKEFDYKIIRHICNSAAIARFPQAHYDMVRLGIGMYGIGVNEKEQSNLSYVHRLKTTITQIRTIKEGESVGYSRNFIAKQPTKIGVIPIGYADGLNRKRGNGNGKVWVNGYLAPIIGNVCMDMCMIDLSGIECSERDDVIIFGDEYPVTNIAKELETIPYEVFTSISTRVKRIFYQE